jgi:hypothetical protein
MFNSLIQRFKNRLLKEVELTIIFYDTYDGDTNTYFILGSQWKELVLEDGRPFIIHGLEVPKLNFYIQLSNLKDWNIKFQSQVDNRRVS